VSQPPLLPLSFLSSDEQENVNVKANPRVASDASFEICVLIVFLRVGVRELPSNRGVAFSQENDGVSAAKGGEGVSLLKSDGVGGGGWGE